MRTSTAADKTIEKKFIPFIVKPLVIIFYALLLAASSWFSFVFIANYAYAGTAEVDSHMVTTRVCGEVISDTKNAVNKNVGRLAKEISAQLVELNANMTVPYFGIFNDEYAYIEEIEAYRKLPESEPPMYTANILDEKQSRLETRMEGATFSAAISAVNATRHEIEDIYLAISELNIKINGADNSEDDGEGFGGRLLSEVKNKVTTYATEAVQLLRTIEACKGKITAIETAIHDKRAQRDMDINRNCLRSDTHTLRM